MQLNPRILLIEDDENLNFIIKSYLERLGYKVDVKMEGRDGLNAAKNLNYDLMVIDIGLPQISGLNIIKTVRRSDIKTPIIVITSKVTNQNELSAYEFGANLFHTKPIKFDLLETQIKALLKERDKMQPIEIGDLHIRPSEVYIEKKGKALNVTPREFGLLMLFIINDERLLTREAIMHELYPGQSVEPSAIDTSISRLRKIIGKFNRMDIIETVYKQGYRINPIFIRKNIQ